MMPISPVLGRWRQKDSGVVLVSYLSDLVILMTGRGTLLKIGNEVEGWG